ncbi:MAG TPA: preprotein translocase subunit SecG [Candidatus Hypogeohydataceae bacterium YC41]
MELRSEKSLKWILASVVLFGIIGALYYLRLVFLLKVFLVLNCLTLLGTILLQAGKGGGLAALGGISDQTAFGTRTSTFLSKLTYFIGAAFIISTICLTKLATTVSVERAVLQEERKAPMPPEHPPVERAKEAAPPALPQPEKEASPTLGWQEKQPQGEKPQQATAPSETQQNPPKADKQ